MVTQEDVDAVTVGELKVILKAIRSKMISKIAELDSDNGSEEEWGEAARWTESLQFHLKLVQYLNMCVRSAVCEKKQMENASRE